MTADDIGDDLPKAEAIVDAMNRLIPHVQPW